MVEQLKWAVGKLEGSLLERGAGRTHHSASELPDSAGDFPQMWKGARAPAGRRRRNRRCPGRLLKKKKLPSESCITMVRSFVLPWWIGGRHSADLGPENFRGLVVF